MRVPTKSECEDKGIVYLYEQNLQESDAEQILLKTDLGISFRMAACLQIGSVKLEALLFCRRGRPAFGYDLFLKESPDFPEWICVSCNNGYQGISEEALRKVMLNEIRRCEFRQFPADGLYGHIDSR